MLTPPAAHNGGGGRPVLSQISILGVKSENRLSEIQWLTETKTLEKVNLRQNRYLYRAVDKYGQTIDFLLTEHRDRDAALRFLTKAIRRHRLPETITIDGSDANEAAIRSYNQEHGTSIIIRQVRYLNNMVEQDHRGVKRITRPMLGFKSFEASHVHAALA